MKDLNKIITKCKKNKALNEIIKYCITVKFGILSLINEEDYSFKNLPIGNVLTRDIEKVIDLMYYGTDNLTEDVSVFTKRLIKVIDNLNIKYKDLYLAMYSINNILKSLSLNEELLDISESDIRGLTFVYDVLFFIEIVLCKTDKRIITGLRDDSIKYLNDSSLVFHHVNLRYITKDEAKVFETLGATLFNSMTKTFPNLTDTECYALSNDKVDECLHQMTLDKIMLSLLDYPATVNKELRLESLSKGLASKVPTSLWHNRDFICDEPEVIYVGDKSDKVKLIKVYDTNLREDIPVTVVSYALKDGREDTTLFMNDVVNIMYSDNFEIIELIKDFYSSKNTIALNLEAWMHRHQKDFEDKIRTYKKTQTFVRWHRAMMGNPSPEKVKEAKRRGIILKEGQTWVKGHIRHYK